MANRRSTLLLALLSWQGFLACGGEEPVPPTPCGVSASGCSDRQHCDHVSVPARCVCNETFSGPSCSECAPGYRRSGSACVAETVVCANGPCGARGECLNSTAGGQACECALGYQGNFCATCVDGYQDNDGDGVCQESCGVASVACPGAEACSDESGEARCICAAGLMGANCDECQPGYRKEPLGDTCVSTCAAAEFECSGTCIETLQGAICECEPGHGGAACDECLETHAQNADGSCVAPLPEDALLWTIARTEQQSYLGALIPPNFAFFPLVPIEDGVTDVAYDGTADVLYALSAGTLVTIDQQTGELTNVIDSASGLGSALARDPTTGLVFVASDDSIWQAELGSGEVTELSTPGVRALDFDESRGILLGITQSGERVEIDPSDGAQRTLSALAEMDSLGLAVDPALGRAYALGGLPEPPEEKLARLCLDIANGLGVPKTARGLALEFGVPLEAGETRVLEESGADPPLVAYGSVDGAPEGGALRVETQHPEALVCVVTEREPIEIVVSQTARFSLLVVVSEEPTVALSVEEGFSAPGAAIHLRTGGEIAVSGPAERVTTYTDAEWEELGLATWSTATGRQKSVLGLIDWRSGSSSFVDLEAPLVGGLSWVGVR